MDIHLASNNNSLKSLPQGFSVYQPTLGAQLQFFPAMGSKELDNMLHAYLPGPAPIADKRAAVSVDFLEHLHMTGQTFKFYQIEVPVAATSVSASSSPISGSGASSLSGFPATPTWDFNSVSLTPPSATSQSSSSALKARKSAKAAAVSRHQTTDFSHLPGMKIMTKDGVDVTNAASRGSKTKEQRDHAHLMRIIKACDSCRAKKIRCDPSHKRKSSSAPSLSATPVPPLPSNSRQKRQKTVSKSTQSTISRPQPEICASLDSVQEFNWDEFDASMAMASMDSFENLENFTDLQDPWSEFIHYPESVDDYSTFFDSEGNVSPLSSLTPMTISSGSSTKPHSPSSAFAHGETASMVSYASTSRSPVDDEHGTWSHELAAGTIGATAVHGLPDARAANIDGRFLRVAANDGSGVPGDYGTDATLLLSTKAVLSQHHRLENPGNLGNSASSTELVDTSPSLSTSLRSSGLVAPSVVDDSPGSCTSQLVDSQALPLSPSTIIVPDLSRNVSVQATARTYVRAWPDAPNVDATTIAPQSRMQSLAGVGDRGIVPGPLSTSGLTTTGGLAHVVFGPTAELTSTSASLPSYLAEIIVAMAIMATSFVDHVLSLASLDRGTLSRLPAQPPSSEVACSRNRCTPLTHPDFAVPSLVTTTC